MTQIGNMVKPKKPFHPRLSPFGSQIGRDTGIAALMDDLSFALANHDQTLCMMGGGQPARIPEIDSLMEGRIKELMNEEGAITKILGEYDPCEGQLAFRKKFAVMLNELYGWQLTEENIAVTAGGQTACFLLMNALAGEGERILLPLIPDYMGYADQLVTGAEFHGVHGKKILVGEDEFKYQIDQDAVRNFPACALMALSRPTNPSGNVVTDDELLFLSDECHRRKIPLLIDNAYGHPFPATIHTAVNPLWQPHHIHIYSLSKCGLPGARTGIVVASPEIIEMVSNMTAVCSLSNSGLGQAIGTPLLHKDGLPHLSNTVIAPFYREKRDYALATLREQFRGLSYRIHAPEGAFFLWLWLPKLTFTSQELTQKLKDHGVLVISGHWFFYAQTQEHDPHEQQCLRLSYSMEASQVLRGLTTLASILKEDNELQLVSQTSDSIPENS